MFSFNDISTRLKEIVKSAKKKEKILDKDLATTLELDPQYYAVIKKRNKIPYEAIAIFCMREKINMNWILLAQKPKYLN